MDILKRFEQNGYNAYLQCSGCKSLADLQTHIGLYRQRFWKGWNEAEEDHRQGKIKMPDATNAGLHLNNSKMNHRG